MSNAEHTLKRGESYPFDAPDGWWNSDGKNPQKSESWEQYAARGVIADLTDRSGIKHGFNGIDEATRSEIIGALAEIIKLAQQEFKP